MALLATCLFFPVPVSSAVGGGEVISPSFVKMINKGNIIRVPTRCSHLRHTSSFLFEFFWLKLEIYMFYFTQLDLKIWKKKYKRQVKIEHEIRFVSNEGVSVHFKLREGEQPSEDRSPSSPLPGTEWLLGSPVEPRWWGSSTRTHNS